jgi:hypothetical protein
VDAEVAWAFLDGIVVFDRGVGKEDHTADRVGEEGVVSAIIGVEVEDVVGAAFDGFDYAEGRAASAALVGKAQDIVQPVANYRLCGAPEVGDDRGGAAGRRRITGYPLKLHYNEILLYVE